MQQREVFKRRDNAADTYSLLVRYRLIIPAIITTMNRNREPFMAVGFRVLERGTLIRRVASTRDRVSRRAALRRQRQSSVVQ